MSGDGGNPPSLRDLLGAYEKSGLGLINRKNVISDSAAESLHTEEETQFAFRI